MPRARTKKPADPIPVDATKHPGDTRTNIPTAELESFAQDEERKPTMLLYPRDTTLDPQLVWKGKDEQDRTHLTVPAVPIYIQETIEPRALIEDLRAQSKREDAHEQVSFFDSFEGMELAERVDFYQHEGKWTNRVILGDSLLVMASLAEKEGLKGQVQMIYMDPPYGIKFGSNWQVSTRRRDVKDGKAEDATRQPEQIRAFRDTWEFGIHSYLTYLRDRLLVSRELLTESGSIFVQIGDQNVHLVRALLDEVFGSKNAVNTIIFKKTSSEETEGLSNVADYLLWYAKEQDSVKRRELLISKVPGGEGGKQYTHKLGPEGEVERLSEEELANPNLLPAGWRVCRRGFPLTSQHFSPTRTRNFEFDGRPYHPGADRQWSLDPDEEMPSLVEMGRIYTTGRSLNALVCLDEMPTTEMGNVWIDTGTGSFTDRQVFVVQTSEKVLQRCLAMATDPGDLVLDPTCGSGTTAFVAEQYGRRWITIDTSRVALAIARTRLTCAKFPYYVLIDKADVRKGFQYKVARHLSLSDIARGTPGVGKELRDQLIEDSAVVRVSGPLTVESLSPHRVLDPQAKGSGPELSSDLGNGRFIEHVMENLRKAGVQNTVKNERLTFDRLEPWPGGVYIQASGEYTENGKLKQVAVSIGPEHGTVGTELVRAAAKEAVKFADLLVICGFAFEALVAEENSRLGRLTILKAKMNPDLGMPDLLKKTGAGNLFMIFGEPDLEVRASADDLVTVEIRGVDVYDPTTGVIRSHSTDDIACWFIDTDYNGESFFVRHAYFLGSDDPYEKLRRVLRADIDEASWMSLYSTTSRPFAKPTTGKFAVKVINHYGDEVLKVYDMPGSTDGR